MAKEKFEVSLGKDGGKIIFKSFDELTTWVTKEREYWNTFLQHPWTNEKQAVASHFQQHYASIDQILQNVKNAKQNAANEKKDPDLTRWFEEAANQFKNFFDVKRGLSSETAKAKYIQKLRNEQGEGVAVSAIGYFMQLPLSYVGFDGIRGAMAAHRFENGLTETAMSHAQALDELRVNWQSVFQKFEQDLIDETGKHKQLNSDSKELLDKQKAEGDTLVSKREKQFDDLVAATKTEWQTLKTTYDADLAIRAPVLYWKNKAGRHLLLSWVFAVLSILVGGGIFTALFYEIKELITPPKGITNPDTWHPEYWRLAIVIASILAGVWIVRLVVRLFLSNVHLLTDANERVTMVQTYLAFIRRKKLSQEDETLILQTLFRPTTTGIMKDDAVPLTAVEAITRIGR